MTRASPAAIRLLLWGMLAASNAIWGASYVVTKLGLRNLSPEELTAWRMIVSGIVLLPIVLHDIRRGTLPARLWPWLILLGVSQSVVSKWCGHWGIQHSTAANTGLLISVEPAFTVALAALALRERLTPALLASLGLGAVGAYLIVFQETGRPSLSGATVAGDAVFLVSLLLEAAYSVASKPLGERYPPLAIVSASLVTGLPVWLPVTGWELAHGAWHLPSAIGWTSTLYLALGCTVFGYWAWVFALRRLPASGVGLSLFLQPLVGTALAIGWLGDRLTGLTIAGALFVLISLGLTVFAPAADSRVASASRAN